MNRHLLITVASRGIGYAIALSFARQGDHVGINYRFDREGARKVCDEAQGIGVQASIYQADVGNAEQVEEMFSAFIEEFKTIDVLVNNAGGGLKIPEGGFEKMPLSYGNEMIALNLNGAAYCSSFAVKNMKENGIKGAIINISSVHSVITYVKRKTFPYCAAKAGLNMLTKTMGVDVIRLGIRVNAIAPGFISTSATTRYNKEELDAFLRKIPAGRLGNTQDITPLVLFLADPEKSGFIVGQTFVVDGGQSIDGTIDYMLLEEQNGKE